MEPRTIIPLDNASELCARLNLSERRVIQLLSYGASNGEVARTLGVSDQTVKNYVSSLMRKMNVPNRTPAAILWVLSGHEDMDLREAYISNTRAPYTPHRIALMNSGCDYRCDAKDGYKPNKPIKREYTFDNMWSFVAQGDGESSCWTWNGPRNVHGRPMIRRDGRWVQPQRYIYMQAAARTIVGMRVLTNCPLSDCMNPRHMMTRANIAAL